MGCALSQEAQASHLCTSNNVNQPPPQNIKLQRPRKASKKQVPEALGSTREELDDPNVPMGHYLSQVSPRATGIGKESAEVAGA